MKKPLKHGKPFLSLQRIVPSLAFKPTAIKTALLFFKGRNKLLNTSTSGTDALFYGGVTMDASRHDRRFPAKSRLILLSQPFYFPILFICNG